MTEKGDHCKVKFDWIRGKHFTSWGVKINERIPRQTSTNQLINNHVLKSGRVALRRVVSQQCVVLHIITQTKTLDDCFSVQQLLEAAASQQHQTIIINLFIPPTSILLELSLSYWLLLS